jgi:hypothetical protein
MTLRLVPLTNAMLVVAYEPDRSRLVESTRARLVEIFG